MTMTMSSCRFRLLFVGVVSSQLASSIAAAADPLEEARAEYDLGAADLDAGRFTSGMAHFARADEQAPNPLTLELALKAALRSDGAVEAMTLADRAEARRVQVVLAREVRRRFAAQTGRAIVRCPEAVECKVRIDGRAAQPESAQWLTVGPHDLELILGDRVERSTIRIDPGATVDVRAVATAKVTEPRPSPIERPAPEATRPVPASVYVAGTIALAGFAAGTYWGLSGFYGDPGLSALERCKPHCAQDDADSVDRNLLWADIGFGVGAVSLAAAIWLFVKRPTVRVVPRVTATGDGVVAGFSWSR